MRDWQFFIDRGGTFTDIVAKAPDGSLKTHKLLSENEAHYPDAAIAGICDLMDVPRSFGPDGLEIDAVKMGTTVATNALLERKGERTVLVTTLGFRDVLAIGNQARPHLFKLAIEKPELLYERVVEVSARMSAAGEELERLHERDLEEQLVDIYENGIRSVAILFLHGWKFPAHEKAAAHIAQKVGFSQISVSHEVSPTIKMVPRGDTTVADAYLTPVLRRYVDQVAEALETGGEGPRLQFMQSNGGLTDAGRFRGKDAILSGPAGGVVGAAAVSKAAGFDAMVGFDMGGTSTDVCHFAGAYERVTESAVAGVRLAAPMMRIETVAAGGGSILQFDGARLRVGPESAGADPGPMSYRKGGPLTVTDANLACGKLLPEFFPKIFGPKADQLLDKTQVVNAFEGLALHIDERRSAEEIADGFVQVAVETMARAIRKISVERGHDVTKAVLTSFGGAGGQHACLVADALEMDHVLIHPFSGILSAYGMGLADIRHIEERTLELPFDHHLAEIGMALSQLTRKAEMEVIGQGVDMAGLRTELRLHVKYDGTDTALEIPADDLRRVPELFDAAHRAQFGFSTPERPLVAALAIAEAIGETGLAPDQPGADVSDQPLPAPAQTTRFFSRGAWHEAAVFTRDSLAPGMSVPGPAIIIEPHATLVVEPDWQARITARNDCVMSRTRPRAARTAIGTSADPIMLEIFNNRFMGIAEEMGAVLEKTASSVNIKERLDFSCALFDATGALVANAPHVPVHLGSMGASVEAVITAFSGNIAPGDAFILNAPYEGGTHLPDVTVMTPVYLTESGEPQFWVAARGHHADIGGLTPGSMPPHSTSIQDEGVLIRPAKLVDKGEFKEFLMRGLLAGGIYPARNPEQNIADVKAQLAACEKGARELKALAQEFSLDVVTAYMGHVQDNAEEAVRRVIHKLKDGEATITLDNEVRITVRITVDQEARSAVINFTGSSDQHDGNFNAPAPVARAAVLYVFRCLVDDDIPLNQGCLKPLDIVLRPESVVNPVHPAAVVAGNVETSQAIVDCLFEALGVLAGSQGTMNNLTFGNAHTQYYETLGGGAGAGKGFDGASGVQVHMTNSRLTDAEVLETRFPVRVERFGFRLNSGGPGKNRGGNGLHRRLRFLEPMEASILSSHRLVPPRGLEGGGDGQAGVNKLTRVDGTEENLKPSDSVQMREGDTLTIQTPGGGGYGTPRSG